MWYVRRPTAYLISVLLIVFGQGNLLAEELTVERLRRLNETAQGDGPRRDSAQRVIADRTVLRIAEGTEKPVSAGAARELLKQISNDERHPSRALAERQLRSLSNPLSEVTCGRGFALPGSR